jgi:hypothetical protein
MARCSVCDSPNATAIDDLLNAGVTQKDVAQQFSLSKFVVSRHVRHAKQEANGNDVGQTEIAKWLARADDQYLLAVANADQRAAVQALIVGLRGIEAKAKSDEREAEASQEQGVMREITIEQWEAHIEKIEASAVARGDDHLLVEGITWFIGAHLRARSSVVECGLILQFLKSALPLGQLCFTQKTGAELLQDFEAFIAKRTATTPELALHGGN